MIKTQFDLIFFTILTEDKMKLAVFVIRLFNLREKWN